MITVVIADDHPLVRDGIVAILTREPDLEVLAQAGVWARGRGDGRAPRPRRRAHGPPHARR